MIYLDLLLISQTFAVTFHALSSYHCQYHNYALLAKRMNAKFHRKARTVINQISSLGTISKFTHVYAESSFLEYFQRTMANHLLPTMNTLYDQNDLKTVLPLVTWIRSISLLCCCLNFRLVKLFMTSWYEEAFVFHNSFSRMEFSLDIKVVIIESLC